MKNRYKVATIALGTIFWWGLLMTAIFGFVSYSQKAIEYLPLGIGIGLMITGILAIKHIAKVTKKDMSDLLALALFFGL